MTLKRKIESTISETVKTSSKVEGSVVKKKPLTKAEFMVKFKALEEGNEKLAKENVKHLETITKLENFIEERTETNENLSRRMKCILTLLQNLKVASSCKERNCLMNRN